MAYMEGRKACYTERKEAEGGSVARSGKIGELMQSNLKLTQEERKRLTVQNDLEERVKMIVFEQFEQICQSIESIMEGEDKEKVSEITEEIDASQYRLRGDIINEIYDAFEYGLGIE